MLQGVCAAAIIFYISDQTHSAVLRPEIALQFSPLGGGMSATLPEVRMEQHRLHWALPPCGSQLIKEECAGDASRQGPVVRSFTASRESRVHKRADLEIRLEFINAQFREESSTNL